MNAETSRAKNAGIIAWRPLLLAVFFLLVLPIGTMIHELGHGIMALACGAKSFNITLIDLGFRGGYCEWYGYLQSVGPSLSQVRLAGGVFQMLFYLGIVRTVSRWFSITMVASFFHAVSEACSLQSPPLMGLIDWLAMLPFAVFLVKSVLEGDLNEDQA